MSAANLLFEADDIGIIIDYIRMQSESALKLNLHLEGNITIWYNSYTKRWYTSFRLEA